jgi:Ca-activated chloride channel family protein
MIRFAEPTYLYFLALIPLLAALVWYVFQRRKQDAVKFASPLMFERLAAEASGKKRVLKITFILLAVTFIILGMANLQVGTRFEEVKQEGVDIFIALDVSLSMKAEDVKPNRLEKAKYEINNLISRLSGDRIGLIVFSGESYVQFPLTTDYSAANIFLDVVDVESVPNPGTAIGSSVQMALRSFNFEEPTEKVLVIITDGENNEGDVLAQAEEAAKKGVLLYTIGMGSPAGAPIPLYDANGRQVDFKRDRSGNIVLTKLDEITLQRMASVGKGKYFRATNSQDELDLIYKEINALQKKEFGTKQFTDFEDKFQYFIGIALLLLCIEVFLSDKKIRWLAKYNPFKNIDTAEE